MNSVGSNKSTWMDRWRTTSSKNMDVDQGEMGGQIAKHELDLDINAVPCNISEYRNSWRYQGEDMAVATSVPHSTQEIQVLAESKRVELTYETLAMNSRSFSDDSRLESEPVSVVKFSEKIGRILAQKRLAVSIEHESITQTDGISKYGYTIKPSSFSFLSEAFRSTPTEGTFQLRDSHSQPGGGSKCQEQLAKPFLSLDKVVGSSSNSLPYVFESRELESSVCRKEKTDQSMSQVATLEHIKRGIHTHVEHKHHIHRASSLDVVCDKQIDRYQAGSRNYDQSSNSWKKDATSKLNDLSSSNFFFSKSHGKPCKGIDDFSAIEHLPSQSCPGQYRRLKKLYSRCHSSSDGLHLVHDNDEIGAFGNVDFVKYVPKEPWIAQTTNHQSIPDMSNRVTSSDYLSEIVPHKRFTLLSDLNRHKERNEKLQPRGSPKSERKIGLKDDLTASLASKNESSAETDTMDINVCRTWSSFPSITSSTSYKDNMVVENPAKSHSKLLRATPGSMPQTELPDINEAPPSSSSPENKDFSASRTESLDAEHLFHFDQAGNSSSSSPRPDPSSRWIKRLKLSSPGYHAHGTKNVKLKESSFTAKNDELYDKLSDLNRTNLTMTFDKRRGEADTMELDRTALLLGNKPASMPSSKDSWDIKLSDPWIQRWCHNQSPRQPMSKEAPISSEAGCSKTASDDYQINEFPSIAAMALMGKAMNGLQACNFQNKGSFIVWGKGKQAEKS